jgi:hypothetical protein
LKAAPERKTIATRSLNAKPDFEAFACGATADTEFAAWRPEPYGVRDRRTDVRVDEARFSALAADPDWNAAV